MVVRKRKIDFRVYLDRILRKCSIGVVLGVNFLKKIEKERSGRGIRSEKDDKNGDGWILWIMWISKWKS